MNKHFENIVVKATNADSISKIQIVQELWSGYGQILRYETSNPQYPTVIVKHINFPKKQSHPAGWSGERSHKRKLKSYKVETEWYKSWADRCSEQCRIPKCLATEGNKREMLIVLEDLDCAGFSQRRRFVNEDELQMGLQWLANFHATFMNETPDGLWKNGTYWHLDTRPDELKALSDEELKKAAGKIDQKLKSCRFKTFVHGDAKLANFCFSKEGGAIAAVDFQYVGGGCGMKDLAYFVGSCYGEDECRANEEEVLQYYFQALQEALSARNIVIDFPALEAEWRHMYHFAWADFHRFLKGWSPGSWRNSSYSEQVTAAVIRELA